MFHGRRPFGSSIIFNLNATPFFMTFIPLLHKQRNRVAARMDVDTRLAFMEEEQNHFFQSPLALNSFAFDTGLLQDGTCTFISKLISPRLIQTATDHQRSSETNMGSGC
jgi:hypothetical protein